MVQEQGAWILLLLLHRLKILFHALLMHFRQLQRNWNLWYSLNRSHPGQPLEECLFHIYEKDLRNVVLWLEDMEISYEALRKLRGLGMNIILFDSVRKNDYADSVFRQ